MTDLSQSLLAFLKDAHPEMVALLKDLAELESPTDDRSAVAHVFDRLESEFRRSDMVPLRIRGRNTGGVLVARPAQRKKGMPLQLLVGHCDTVWPVGTRDHMPVLEVENQLRGPGVFDMKAGLVQMIFAIRALRAANCNLEVTPVVLVNSDEETGSRESRRTTVRLAQRAVRAFVLEPAFGPHGRP